MFHLHQQPLEVLLLLQPRDQEDGDLLLEGQDPKLQLPDHAHLHQLLIKQDQAHHNLQHPRLQDLLPLLQISQEDLLLRPPTRLEEALREPHLPEHQVEVLVPIHVPLHVPHHEQLQELLHLHDQLVNP